MYFARRRRVGAVVESVPRVPVPVHLVAPTHEELLTHPADDCARLRIMESCAPFAMSSIETPAASHPRLPGHERDVAAGERAPDPRRVVVVPAVEIVADGELPAERGFELGDGARSDEGAEQRPLRRREGPDNSDISSAAARVSCACASARSAGPDRAAATASVAGGAAASARAGVSSSACDGAAAPAP